MGSPVVVPKVLWSVRQDTRRLAQQQGCAPGQRPGAGVVDQAPVEVPGRAVWPVAHAAFAAAADPVLEQAPALVAHLGIDEHRRGRPRWRIDEQSGEYIFLADRWHTCYRCCGGWGGGGMVATLGAGSGQTSRTGQGAWSTMKRLAGPRLRGPRRARSPSRARMSRSAPSAAADDFPFGAAGALAAGAGAPQARRCGGEELAGGGGGEVFQPGAGVALGACAAEQPGVGAAGGAGDLGAGDVQQRDAGVVRCPGAGGVHAGGPGALDDPGDDGHGDQPPMAVSEAHSASTASTRAAGTASRPRRVNSARSTSVSCSRMMRRHSRVASDPA